MARRSLSVTSLRPVDDTLKMLASGVIEHEINRPLRLVVGEAEYPGDAATLTILGRFHQAGFFLEEHLLHLLEHRRRALVLVSLAIDLLRGDAEFDFVAHALEFVHQGPRGNHKSQDLAQKPHALLVTFLFHHATEEHGAHDGYDESYHYEKHNLSFLSLTVKTCA